MAGSTVVVIAHRLATVQEAYQTCARSGPDLGALLPPRAAGCWWSLCRRQFIDLDAGDPAQRGC